MAATALASLMMPMGFSSGFRARTSEFSMRAARLALMMPPWRLGLASPFFSSKVWTPTFW